MRLEFSLLIVDDDPDGIEQAIHILSEHLETKGFVLKKSILEDLSEEGIRKLTPSQGRNYDLVMVDYRLGQDDKDRNGAALARELRQRLPYVDMVFYSSDPVPRLLAHLSNYKVSGVFAQEREELSETLIGLADTVIGKVADLNHMRGITMAEVAEMDILMKKTLVCVFRSNDQRIVGEMLSAGKRKQKNMEKNLKQLESHINKSNLFDIVNNNQLFSSVDIYRAIRKLAEFLPEKLPEPLKFLKSYEEDIIQKRNMPDMVPARPGCGSSP